MLTRSSLIMLLVLAISCGKAMENSKDPKAVNASMTLECQSFRVNGVEFLFGGHEDTNYPSRLQTALRCGSTVLESFNAIADGEVTEITNSDERITYSITHRTGTIMAGESTPVDIFFGAVLELMYVQYPMTLNGAMGVDRGINSGDADSNHLDTMVIEFTRPISYFATRVVGLKKNSTIRLFGCDGLILKEHSVVYPNNESGHGEVHHLGFISETEDVCYVAITSSSNTAAVALDDMFYGVR